MNLFKILKIHGLHYRVTAGGITVGDRVMVAEIEKGVVVDVIGILRIGPGPREMITVRFKDGLRRIYSPDQVRLLRQGED
jgi:hypothetical protein